MSRTLSPQQRRWIAVSLAVAGLLLLLFWRTQGSGPGQSARLETVNLCDAGWKITAKSASGAKFEWEVPGKATREVTLPAGPFTFEQRLLDNTGLNRTLAMKLDPGEHYRWALVTLLTPVEESSKPASQEPDVHGAKGGAR